MKDRELIGILFWIAMGLLFCIGAFKLRLFEENIPGPGFFPFIVGIFLVSLGIVLLILTHLRHMEEKIFEEKFFPEKDSLKKLFLAVLALSIYGIGLEYLGFLFMTFIFMIILLRFIEPQKWIFVFTASTLITAVSYIIFQILLKAQLPKGILGI